MHQYSKLRTSASNRSLITSAALAAMLGLNQQLAKAQSDDRYIGGTTGLWSTPANWSLGVPTTPTGGITTTSIINSDGIARTVTYDYTGPAVTIAPLTIDLTGGTTGAANSLVMAQGALSATGNETVGLNGNGSFTQSGGTNTLTNNLFLGFNVGSTGIYSIGGGSLSDYIEYVGYDGTGNFIQTGGTNTVGSELNIGGDLANSTTGVGTYSLSGNASSILTVNATEEIGVGGAGTRSGVQYSAVFNQSGGANNVAASIFVGDGSSAAYYLSAGTVSSTGIVVSAGNLFYQTGGTITTLGLELIGESGTYTAGATGKMIQTGGANTIGTPLSPQTLDVGVFSTDQDSYALSGSGTLTVNGTEIISDQGTGSFNQSGGTHTVTGGTFSFGGTFPYGVGLIVGNSAGTVGTFTLSGGSLAVGTGASVQFGSSEYIGFNGTGSFVQTGGTHTVGTAASYQSLDIGVSPSGIGSYILSGSSSTLLVNYIEYVGGGGVGLFNQSGGQHTVTGGLILGVVAGSAGTYLLSGGTLAVNGSPDEVIGEDGNGTFVQTGGTHTIGSAAFSGISFDINAGMGNGTYQLSGDSSLLSVYGTEFVGKGFGLGTFIQSGGTHIVAQDLVIGLGPGSYTLNSGTLSIGGTLNVNVDDGDGSTQPIGKFAQHGGTSSASSITVYGNYLLDGGTSNAGSMTIGFASSPTAASAMISGNGILSVFSTIEVATAAAAQLNLNGGTINAGAIQLDGGPSQFNWTSGTLNITNNVTFDPLGTSTSAIFGAALSLGASQTLQISGDETLGGTGPFSLTLNSGSNHLVTGNLYLPKMGTLTQNAGSTLDYSLLEQEGGTINGTLTNQTSFLYFSGAFNGRLVNQGSAQIEGNFSAPGGIENDSGLLIGGTTTQISFGGPGLDNFGTIVLASGQSLSGTNFVNEASGSFTWGGTVATPVTNYGLIAIGQGSAVSAANTLTNYGTIEFDYTASLRNSGGIENQGTISLGNGTISGTAAVINDTQGMIETIQVNTVTSPSGITSPLTNRGGVIQVGTGTILTLSNFAGGNINGGQIQIQSNATLNSTLAFPSSGTIVLQGTGATLGGGTITNTGTISGAGRISSVVSNAGVVTAVGGQLTLSAAGDTNPAAGQLQAVAGGTLLFSQGLATNSGMIALAGGTFDNNNAAITNHGNIVGNGTFRSGALTNATDGTVLFTDANSSVYGNVNNVGNLRVISNTTTFYGTVNNTGTIEVTSGVARFLGNGISMTVGGTYRSDPSDNYFNGLNVSTGGTVLGGIGDRFFITGGTTLTNGGTWNSSGSLSATAIVNTGAFTQLGPLTEYGNFTNTGSVTLAGTQNWSSGTSFTNNAGTSLIQTDLAGSGISPAVNVSGGTVTFAVTQHLSNLTVSSGIAKITGGSPGQHLFVYTPAIAVSGTFDLAANDLDVHAGNLGAITALIFQGFHNGSWTGNGIISSNAAADSKHLTALGVIQNATTSTTPLYTSFDGSPVMLNDILVRLTYYGDTNLDGKVDGSDYSRIDFAYLADQTSPFAYTGWFNGDFNYDGVVNGSDYTLIDNAFNTQGSALTSEIADPAAALTSEIASQTPVPEPGIGGIGLLLGTGMLRRRQCAITRV